VGVLVKGVKGGASKKKGSRDRGRNGALPREGRQLKNGVIPVLRNKGMDSGFDALTKEVMSGQERVLDWPIQMTSHSGLSSP